MTSLLLVEVMCCTLLVQTLLPHEINLSPNYACKVLSVAAHLSARCNFYHELYITMCCFSAVCCVVFVSFVSYITMCCVSAVCCVVFVSFVSYPSLELSPQTLSNTLRHLQDEQNNS